PARQRHVSTISKRLAWCFAVMDRGSTKKQPDQEETRDTVNTDQAELYLATIAENWAAVAATPVWGDLEDPDTDPRERIRRFLVAFFTPFERNATLPRAPSTRGGEFPELRVGFEDNRRVMGAWVDRLTALLTAAGRFGPVTPEYLIGPEVE